MPFSQPPFNRPSPSAGVAWEIGWRPCFDDRFLKTSSFLKFRWEFNPNTLFFFKINYELFSFCAFCSLNFDGIFFALLCNTTWTDGTEPAG